MPTAARRRRVADREGEEFKGVGTGASGICRADDHPSVGRNIDDQAPVVKPGAEVEQIRGVRRIEDRRRPGRVGVPAADREREVRTTVLRSVAVNAVAVNAAAVQAPEQPPLRFDEEPSLSWRIADLRCDQRAAGAGQGANLGVECLGDRERRSLAGDRTGVEEPAERVGPGKALLGGPVDQRRDESPLVCEDRPAPGRRPPGRRVLRRPAVDSVQRAENVTAPVRMSQASVRDRFESSRIAWSHP